MQLTELTYLELGDNRIKKIENLSTNKKIQRLFLGANQIQEIENLDDLENLEVLSLPANAIQTIKVSCPTFFFAQESVFPPNSFMAKSPFDLLAICRKFIHTTPDLKYFSKLF